MNEKVFNIQAGVMARQLRIHKGDFLVVRYDADKMVQAKGGKAQDEASIVDIAKRLTMHPALKGVFIITMPAGMELEHLPPADMARVGWIRKDPEPVWLSCTRCKVKRIGTPDMEGWQCQAVRTEGGVCDGTLVNDGPTGGPKVE